MARTWGGIQHRLIATTHVSSSWVRAVHLVQVDQTVRAAQAAKRAGDGEVPTQVFDPLFALQLLKTLAYLRQARGTKRLSKAMRLLQGIAAEGQAARGASRATSGRVAGAGIYMAVSFIGGPTCVYPLSDEHDYNVLRAASSVGKAFHMHYYRKGRGKAYYQISAEARRQAIF